MDKFINKIVSCITSCAHRLSIVRNADGFLCNPDVQNRIMEQSQLIFVKGSNLEFRVHFELEYKTFPNIHYCYLSNNPDTLLADIRNEAYITDFVIVSLFQVYFKPSLRNLDFEILSILYEENPIRNLSQIETENIINNAQKRIQIKQQNNYDICSSLKNINPDWTRPFDVISKASELILEAIRQDSYNKIETEIKDINESFQQHLKENYFGGILPSSYMIKPKVVSKILPYLKSKYAVSEKIAVVVIDGMTYWQFLILKSALSTNGISTQDDCIYSWIPSITMLSRQAIFRGENPLLEYKQNPSNEHSLWFSYWQNKGINNSEILYLYDDSELNIPINVTRLAYVSSELDHKMHASSNNKDLCSLTENWNKKFLDIIINIKNKGFKIFITTDHGNIKASAWRSLTSQEKTYLYQDGSRGARHLIYSNKTGMDYFISENSKDVANLLIHDNWLIRKDSKCFKSKNIEITHGGSHFLEVLVPFITI